MRALSTVFLASMMAGACASSPTAAPATEHQAVAAGGETPCGSAQVFFATGSDTLDRTAEERLASYAACIERGDTDVVYVAGMTDPEGEERDNLVLGRSRALAVADFLRGHGVTVAFRVRTVGEEGAVETPDLWPIERSAQATAVDVD